MDARAGASKKLSKPRYANSELNECTPHLEPTHLKFSTKKLEKELGSDSMNNYIARRQLRWLGHVSRMPFDRLPRRALSSWLPSTRCRGAAKMTYGRTMKKAMAIFDINPQNWYELAADRKKWHARCNDQMTILLALSSRTTYHIRTEYIHAPPLFLCLYIYILVSFLSHFPDFGESWNLCSCWYRSWYKLTTSSN